MLTALLHVCMYVLRLLQMNGIVFCPQYR